MDKATTDFMALRKSTDDLLDDVDRIGSNRNYVFSSNAIEEAKIKIKGAVRKLTGESPDKRISDAEQSRMLEVIKDIPRRGRRAIVLIEAEDGSGIIELTTGKLFPYEANTKATQRSSHYRSGG